MKFLEKSDYGVGRALVIAVIFVFLFVLAFTAAGEEKACTPLAAHASEKYLLQLQENYRKIRSLKAKFKQSSYLQSLDLSEDSEGQLVLQMPGKLFWEYRKPEPQVFLLSDDEFRLYQPLDKQLLIQSLESFFLSDIPVSFLLGVGNLTTDFTIEKGCTDKQEITLTLRPRITKASYRNDERALHSLVLTFSSTELFPETTEILDSEGNKTLLKIFDRVDNAPVGSGDFDLKVPPGTDIQDLRR